MPNFAYCIAGKRKFCGRKLRGQTSGDLTSRQASLRGCSSPAANRTGSMAFGLAETRIIEGSVVIGACVHISSICEGFSEERIAHLKVRVRFVYQAKIKTRRFKNMH